jgi:hypothetical protein
METMGGDASVVLPEGGVGPRGPVTADDVEGVRRGQGPTEGVEEIDEPHIHLLRLSRQGIAKDMVDPAEFVGDIIPCLPKHRIKLFPRMGVE